MNSNNDSESNLVRRTLQTAGVLVAACVVFVGLLSIVAVFVTSRAVNAHASGASEASVAQPAANTPSSGATKTSASPEHAKKPLSI